MRIINFSKSLDGGAGKACLRFHNFFLKKNYESYIYIEKENKKFNLFDFAFQILRKLKNRFNFLQKIIIKLNPYCIYSFQELSNQKKINIKHQEIDKIIIHWCDDYLNLHQLIDIKKKLSAEVIFMIYDMYYLTGGCHYSFGCEKFQTLCSNCPGVPFFFKKKIEKQFKIKKKIIEYLEPKVIVFSQQDYNLVKNSSINYKNIIKSIIPIDTKIFNAKNRIKNKFLSFLTSVNHYDPRKGYYEYEYFLDKFDKKLDQKVIFYYTKEDQIFKKNYKNINFIKFDFLNSEDELAKFYKKIDFYINFSNNDSAPMMINEALLSGVPVISKAVGHAKEYIISYENGIIVEDFLSTKSINEIIKYVLSENIDNFKISENFSVKCSQNLQNLSF